MSFSRRCIIAVGVFAALSCNSDRPTQPPSEAPTPTPQFSTTQIGGGTLGSPGTTTGGGGATGWTPMGSTVPNAFILIQVTGKIDIATNQACTDTFTLPCQYPLSGESVGPMGDTYGWLKVSVKEVGGSTVGLSGPVGGSSAEGLIYGMGGVVQASRTGAAQNGQSCMANPVHPGDVTNCPKKGDTKTYVEVGSYLLIGSQNVTILKIDPLSAQATPSTVLQGGQITFTATVDPHLPASTLQWYWVPGETGSGQDGNPQGTLTGGGYIGCYGQTTCTYTPLKSGRMYVEGKLVNHWTHKGTSVTVNPITLTATPGAVYALDTVMFTAQIGGGLTATGWNWYPDPPPPPPLADRTATGAKNRVTQRTPIGKLPHSSAGPGKGVIGGPEAMIAAGPAVCRTGYNDCEAPVPVSGTESVTVKIAGLNVRAGAHVSISPPTLIVTCYGSNGAALPVKRGDPVYCFAKVLPNTVAFTLVAGRGDDVLGHSAQSTFASKPVAAGDSTSWGGLAAVETIVTLSAKVTASGDLITPASNTYTVVARSWPRISGPVAVLSNSPTSTATDIAYPPAIVDANGATNWGYGSKHTGFGTPQWKRTPFNIQDGPNRGWAILSDPAQMVGVNIVYSAGLASPDPWYLRQHARTAGDPPGTWAYCTQQDVDFMKNQVWQHEGATSGWPPPNHMQYLNTYLQNNDVQVEWERVMAFDANNGALLASQLQLDAIHDQQLQFIDTPLASAQLLNVDPPPWGVGQPFVKPNCTVRP